MYLFVFCMQKINIWSDVLFILSIYQHIVFSEIVLSLVEAPQLGAIKAAVKPEIFKL